MSGLRGVAVRLSDGKEVALGGGVSLEVGESLDSPAQTMEGVFPITQVPGKLGAVRVYSGSSLLFQGNTDRQQVAYSGAGLALSLEARSKGAFLLDNEALPSMLTNVRLTTIFNRFIAPYGFLCYNPNPSFCLASYTIRKDMSEWEVLDGFTRRAWGITPYVRGDQVIIDRPRSSAILTFSNTGDGVPFSRLEHTYTPYKMVSQVVIRDALGGYTAQVTNSSAGYHGVRRKRYVIPTNEFVDEPGLDANARIRRSMLDSEGVSVTCPGLVAAFAGQQARVVDDTLQLYNLLVGAVTWRQGAQGVVTTLKLVSSVYY